MFSQEGITCFKAPLAACKAKKWKYESNSLICVQVCVVHAVMTIACHLITKFYFNIIFSNIDKNYYEKLVFYPRNKNDTDQLCQVLIVSCCITYELLSYPKYLDAELH